MKIKVLGNFGPFPAAGGNTSGYLLQTETENIAFEMGEGIFSALRQDIPPEKLDALIISHFHFDHSCDLGIFCYYIERLKKRGVSPEIPLFIPYVDCEIVKYIMNKDFFKVVFVEENQTYKIGKTLLEFFEVNHPVKTYGFVAENEGKRFGFTADSRLSGGVEKIASRSDLFLADGAFLNRELTQTSPHMSVFQAASVGKKFAAKTLITHLSPDCSEQEMLEEAKSIYDNVEIAKPTETYFI